MDLSSKVKVTTIRQPALATGFAAFSEAVVIDTQLARSTTIIAIYAACTATKQTSRTVVLRSGTVTTATLHVACVAAEVIGATTALDTAAGTSTVAAIARIGYRGADRYVSVYTNLTTTTGVYAFVAVQEMAKTPQ